MKRWKRWLKRRSGQTDISTKAVDEKVVAKVANGVEEEELMVGGSKIYAIVDYLDDRQAECLAACERNDIGTLYDIFGKVRKHYLLTMSEVVDDPKLKNDLALLANRPMPKPKTEGDPDGATDIQRN